MSVRLALAGVAVSSFLAGASPSPWIRVALMLCGFLCATYQQIYLRRLPSPPPSGDPR